MFSLKDVLEEAVKIISLLKLQPLSTFFGNVYVSFYFRIVLDSKENWADNTKDFHASHTQFPLLLTSDISMVHLLKYNIHMYY